MKAFIEDIKDYIFILRKCINLARLGLGAIVFLEMHFIVSLNQGFADFKFGIQEVICAFTVFSFYVG